MEKRGEAATMKVPYRDLRIAGAIQRKEYLDAIENVYNHGRFIMGPEVYELEASLCAYSDKKYCITVSSGTFALYATLEFLKQTSDHRKSKVILPSISWIATAQSVIAAGCEPIFIDTDENFFIDVNAVQSMLSSQILAIIGVDFTGQVSPNIIKLQNMADDIGAYFIQDSAQSFGAQTICDGNKVAKSCSMGFASCLSINSMKILPSHGEGGAIFTDSDELKEFAKRFRYQGCLERIPQQFGLNGRMETLQAAITLKSLKHVDGVIKSRQNIASHYNQCLREYSEIKAPHQPNDHPGSRHTYYSYQINVGAKRDQLAEFLKSEGIEIQLQYPYLMCDIEHLQNYNKTSMPMSRSLSNGSLCLPCHEKLSQEQLEFVITKIKTFFGK